MAGDRCEPVMQLLDFLSAGPCRQREGMRNKMTGTVMTTCEECPGLMWAGECARERLRASLAPAIPPEPKGETDAR